MTDTFWSGYGNALSAIGNVGGQIANRRAGARLGAGDYKGAAGALFDAGDLNGGVTLQNAARTQQTADAARQWEVAQRTARTLEQTLAQGGDVLATFDQLTPVYRQMGTDDNQIAQLRQGLAANPQQFLQAIKAAVPRELQIENLGEGYGVALDKATGEVVNRYERPRVPQRVAVGDDYIEVAADGSVRPLYQGAQDPEYIKLSNSNGTDSVIAVGGREGGVIAPRGGGAADAVSVIQEVLPGVSFNSGLRTPEQNRSAGGAPNSYHLRGQAVDIPRQPGQTVQQLRAQLEARGVTVKEALDEGDHWHIAWEGGPQAANFGRGEAPRPGGGIRTIASGQDNGPTPAAARAEDREARVASRQARTDARQLRRDFEAQDGVKEYETVRSSYNRLRALAASGSATDDTAVGFEFMKMLDPTSVVRESEYALVGQSQGIGGQALVALQRLSTGQRLTPELRRNLVETGERVFQGRQARYNELVQQYRGYAEEDGFDPDRVVPLRGSSGQGAQSGLVAAPGLRFQITPGQMALRQRVISSGGSPRARVGDRQNPSYINPSDPNGSYANVPRGGYFVTPDGTLRGPKP